MRDTEVCIIRIGEGRRLHPARVQPSKRHPGKVEYAPLCGCFAEPGSWVYDDAVRKAEFVAHGTESRTCKR